MPESNVNGEALTKAIRTIQEGGSLTRVEASQAFDVLMDGRATAEEMEALLLGLRTKGETADEIVGAAESLRAVMLRIAVPSERLTDTCGTGGGGVSTFNISSAASFVAAGAGVRIAKHGNRSHTTRSGSADLFESLGIDIGLSPDQAERVLNQVGLVFLFAPQYHPAMRHVAPTRKKVGVSTIMNLVGPLVNPAGVRRQVMGVFERSRGPLVAEAMAGLGADRAMVMHAKIGMDEISPCGETEIWEVIGSTVRPWVVNPGEFGLACEDMAGLAGGQPETNAGRVERLLAGNKTDEAGRSAVLLNAGAAVYVAHDHLSFGEALERARHAMDSGAGNRVLQELRRAAPR